MSTKTPRPKMTAKYSAAIRTAHNHGLPAKDTRNQEELYTLLQTHNFFWDSNAQSWDYCEPAEADDPTPLILVRVWGNAETVEAAAALLQQRMVLQWELVEKSPPYLCRPPKQKEARVYLKFLPVRQ